MFVVFENGGKQYKCSKGDVLKIESCNCKKGDILKFNTILLHKNDKNETIVGTPFVKELELICKVLDLIKDKKVLVFKKKRRHNYRRKLGHRQNLVVIKVTDIRSGKSTIEKSLENESSFEKVKNKSDKIKIKKSEVKKDGP
tara:strand:- start:504 stop:929 length:426 start_codon:yes stop_codon:yes gene_type:complete